MPLGTGGLTTFDCGEPFDAPCPPPLIDQPRTGCIDRAPFPGATLFLNVARNTAFFKMLIKIKLCFQSKRDSVARFSTHRSKLGISEPQQRRSSESARLEVHLGPPQARLRRPLSYVPTHVRPARAGHPLCVAPFVTMNEDDRQALLLQRERATEKVLRVTQLWQVTIS